MQTPSVDIIVPVWNSPFETRACLAAVLHSAPEARLIIVDNGSNRETELMLEEFSESLGERGLFITSERNLGLVPAINIGLARSDGEIALILQPHVQVSGTWLAGLAEALQTTHAGIASPVFSGGGAPLLPPVIADTSLMETFCVSFAALALKREMHRQLGGFDENLDGGEWCLKDYVRRAWSRGYHSCVTSRSHVVCGEEAVFGSEARRQQQSRLGRVTYRERWGISRHYCIYFGRDTAATTLSDAMETIVLGARQGHRFTLLLHRRLAADFRRLGWHARHTGIEVQRISPLMPRRDLLRRMAALQAACPDIIPVRYVAGIDFPGMTAPISFGEVADAIRQTRDEESGEPAPLSTTPEVATA
ncbi:MAG TPA: glycosyltransferase [Desulfuromonadaceae bacterium]